jgi:hypothetical protein
VGALIPTGAGAYDVEFAPGGAIAWVVDTNTNDVRGKEVAGQDAAGLRGGGQAQHQLAEPAGGRPGLA